MSTITADQLSAIGRVLNDANRPIGQRFRALFTLRNIGGTGSVDQICECLLADESALLKHECAYCLGQIQDTHAIPVLNRVLANTAEHPMVRHEAAEALGAIGDRQSLDVLKVRIDCVDLSVTSVANCLSSYVQKYLNDSNKSVSETCSLAIQRIEYLSDETKERVMDTSVPFKSVDPVPAVRCDETDIGKLEALLTDANNDLFSRYRAMFALRNLNTDASARALANGLQCPDSALFRHEVAYVLGQMQKPCTVAQLAANLADFGENEMVRHECAEALGN
ncbi:unnamed protein product, partial [Oppiella nova]